MPDPLDRRLAPLRNRAFAPTPLSAIAARASRLRRRRRQRNATATGVLAAGLVAGLISAGPLGGGHSVTVTTAPPSPVSTSGWSGELAYVSGGKLVIVARSGHHVTVSLPGKGLPTALSWSTDGRWLAFQRGASGVLWVVRADGSGADALGSATEFAWDPAADTVAYVHDERLTLASMGSAQVHIPPTGSISTPEALAWSPTGDALAVGTVAYSFGRDTGELLLLPVGAEHSRVLATSHAYGFELAGWWPNGKGLLYWKDEAFSASIAADGLPLVSRDLASGRTHVLATTLTHPDWLAWSPDGGTVAVTAGPDRVVWNGAKHLVLCQVAIGTCAPEPQPEGTTSIDPAWTADGQLVFARSTGIAAYTDGPPPGVPGLSRSQPFAWKAVEGWAAIGELRTAPDQGGEPQGSGAVAGGAGGQEPTPAGANLLYVRSGDLWLLLSGSAKPTRLTGRLGPYGVANPGYYGYIDWHQDFAWHA